MWVGLSQVFPSGVVLAGPLAVREWWCVHSTGAHVLERRKEQSVRGVEEGKAVKRIRWVFLCAWERGGFITR